MSQIMTHKREREQYQAILRALRGPGGKPRSVEEIQRMASGVQYVALAKGLIEPGDLRVGGTLTPEQSDALVSAIVESPTLGRVRTVRMRRTTRDVDVSAVAARQLQRVTEGNDPSTLTETSNPGAKLTALPAQLFASIGLQAIRDNADNPGLVGWINGELARAFQRDIEDLGFNGTHDDYAGAAFLRLNKGWPTIAIASAVVAGEQDCRAVEIAPDSVSQATGYTGVVASNNALTWTAVQEGSPGNEVRVILKDPVGNNQTLAVTVSGTVVTVSLATGAGGAITSTAALVKAGIEASGNAAALVTVAHTGASTGAAAVTAQNIALQGGRYTGWIETLGAVRAAADPQWRATSVFVMSQDDADAYDIEVGQHVTGAPVIATNNENGFLRAPILPSAYMPAGTILYTPPENLVLGMHTDMRRDAEYHARRRAVEITMDMSFDFEIAIKRACVVATRA